MRQLCIVLTVALLWMPAFEADIRAQNQAWQASASGRPGDIVDFNTANLKYHDPNCIWAKRCTVHCIKIARAEAKRRGGIPCKICNGGE